MRTMVLDVEAEARTAANAAPKAASPKQTNWIAIAPAINRQIVRTNMVLVIGRRITDSVGRLARCARPRMLPNPQVMAAYYEISGTASSRKCARSIDRRHDQASEALSTAHRIVPTFSLKYLVRKLRMG